MSVYGVSFLFTVFMFYYHSHTVCLHLLVLYCNNCPSACAHPPCFELDFFFLVIVSHLFLCSHLLKSSVGWSNFTLGWIWFNYCIYFVCFCACCSKILQIQTKLDCHLSLTFKYIFTFRVSIYLDYYVIFVFDYPEITLMSCCVSCYTYHKQPEGGSILQVNQICFAHSHYFFLSADDVTHSQGCF